MPVIIKSFLGVFFFVLVVFLGIGIISYQTDINQAVSYKRDIIREIQNSNFSPSVMNACILTGAENHYEISIEVSFEDGSLSTYNASHLASGNFLDASVAYVTVNYKSSLPFLGIETSNSLRGFAR